MTQTIEEQREKSRYWKVDKRRFIILLAVIGGLALLKPELYQLMSDFISNAFDAIKPYRPNLPNIDYDY